jgi:hypothetical protein
VLRAVARWTVVALVFAGTAGATAYGITERNREDLPGLATASDGRWVYPALAKPALPSGSPPPFVAGNEIERHHADIRDLLLPAPEGAKRDPGLPGPAEWTSVDDFVEVYDADYQDSVREDLTAEGSRHIASNGWTMPDGTRTRIDLVRFATNTHANSFSDLAGDRIAPNYVLAEAAESERDATWTSGDGPPELDVSVYDEVEPQGSTRVRHAYVRAGDVVALITHFRPADAEGTGQVPFHQTLLLQGLLLA